MTWSLLLFIGCRRYTTVKMLWTRMIWQRRILSHLIFWIASINFTMIFWLQCQTIFILLLFWLLYLTHWKPSMIWYILVRYFINGYILYWYGYVNSLLLFILVNVDCMVCEEHKWLGCVRELSHGLRPALVWHWTLTKGVRPFMDFKLICSAWKPNWCRTGRGWGVVRVLALV